MKTDPRVARRRCKCRRVHHIDTRHDRGDMIYSTPDPRIRPRTCQVCGRVVIVDSSREVTEKCCGEILRGNRR